MRNLFDIQCPKCRGTDNLRVLTDEGRVFDLGPWCNLDELAETAARFKNADAMTWLSTGVGCGDCGFEGPLCIFEGGLAKSMRKRLPEAIRKLGETLDRIGSTED